MCFFLRLGVLTTREKKTLFIFYCFDFVDSKIDFSQWSSYYITGNYQLCFKMRSKSFFFYNEVMFVKRQMKTQSNPRTNLKIWLFVLLLFFLRTSIDPLYLFIVPHTSWVWADVVIFSTSENIYKTIQMPYNIASSVVQHPLRDRKNGFR